MYLKKISVTVLFLAFIFIVSFAGAGDERNRISDLKNDYSNDSNSSAERRFGRELSARILGNYPLLDNDKANRYLNLVGKGIALYAGGEITEYHFGILNSDEINAFAAPGGYVFITRGAMMKMENEAQLAAVLGHEITHIVKRHVIKELDIKDDKDSAVGGIAALIGGATGGFRGTFDKALSNAEEILFRKGYMIENEIEADQTGIILSAMAGYDPHALKDFLVHSGSFEKGNEPSNGNHPVLKTRIEKIDVVISENKLQDISGLKNRERYHDNIKKIHY